MKKKRYISIFLALTLCWGGAALSDDDNPFEEVSKEENPLSEAENPFAEVVKGNFNGRYIGKLIDLRLWPEGEIFAGEMKFRGETYPVAAEMKDGGLFCAAGTEEENFTFTLKKDGEKYVVEVGKFREELEKREFPVLKNNYEGEKGTKIQISKKTVDHYIGTIEFKGRKMVFEADVKGGTLEGKIESGKSQIDFKIERGEEKLTFQTGAFTDELMSETDKEIAPYLKAAREAKEKHDWIRVQEEAEKILKIDKEHKGAKGLLESIRLKKPQKGELFTVQLSGGVKLEMIGIEPGTFMMGSPNSELGRFDEETQHQVTLTKGYWLGKYEVTQGQYKTIMGTNPSEFTGNDNLPVEMVSWNEAMEFCRKLTEQERTAGRLPEGYTYTLPTEAEWEYACRAGTRSSLNSEKNLSDKYECSEMDEVGWYGYNSDGKTHPIGQKKPNAWGLYDMHGNVLEWCLDYCDYDGNNNIIITDTYRDGIRDPLCKTGSSRVIRGGRWSNSAYYCRSASRNNNNPSDHSSCNGFRMCLSPVQ